MRVQIVKMYLFVEDLTEIEIRIFNFLKKT
jgi:hypothetical protein